MVRNFRVTARRGLTLIELVVVMAILTVLAAMVIPRLDFLKNQAEHATSASTAQDLATVLQVQKTSNGSFPSLDLLVDESGAAYSKLFNIGSPMVNAGTLSVSTGERWYSSLQDGGLLYGMRNSSTATNASDSGTIVTDLVNEAASGTLKVAEVNLAATYAGDIVKAAFPGGVSYQITTPAVADDPATTTVDETAPAVYGWVQSAAGTVPAGTKLIAMGFGAKSSAVGNTITSVPMETSTDDPTKVYCRYIAIFAIYSNGKPAQLKMVVDHRFKQVSKRIDQYKSSGI